MALPHRSDSGASPRPAPAPGTLPLTKVLDPGDYDHPDLQAALARVDRLAATGALAGQHPHRRWEYALAMAAIDQWASHPATPLPQQPYRIYDVGGAGSPFATLLEHGPIPARVHVVDPTTNTTVEYAAEQRLYPPAEVITAISVIEHVPQPRPFLRACVDLLAPGGLLVLTADYWDSEGPDVAHCHWMRARIYHRETWSDVIAHLRGLGLRRWGGCDWTYHGPQVYDYSFVSLVMRKPLDGQQGQEGAPA